jgi:hypothetical protein
MNDDRTFEQRISAWLDGEAVGGLSDRVLDAVFDETRAVHRRTSPVAGRFRQMSRYASTLVAVGAAAIIVVAGAALLGSTSPAASGPASPAGSTGAVIYPTPAPYQTNVEPTLQPSQSPRPVVVDASAFSAPFTITWPEPVGIPWVRADSVQIRPRYAASFNALVVGRVGTDPCHSQDLTAATLKTPQALMDWLAGIPHVTAGPVSTISLGGKPALQRDITVGSLSDCLDIQNLHTGIKTSLDNGYPGGFYIGTGQVRWIAMTVDGKLIAITVGPLTSAAFMTEATEAMATLQFLP